MEALSVVGGGIAGLALAACLDPARFRVTVHERREEPPSVETSLAMWPEAQQALDGVGILPAVRGAGSDFGAMALRDAANESTVALLEPIDKVEITVADDSVGAVLADLRGRRGQVHGTETAQDLAGYAVIHAEVPAHELSRYPIDLRSVSHGTGTFKRSFVRYDYMPAALAREVITA